ncbi:MAG: hypothetical protein A3K19_27995 [Lentisphaerae bacterium RIFOXYB12_FULL_65_16]|nr:MAG: hypothetical protein A3K18_02655 [Lentisphaerae bacterium RIFOXYA12_64_32]OGV88135.1 MAG: hypothetical protein A3K19_27995 [Lentisphaerae bacterium RIFOXYB12_FULL_65_16]
MLIAALTTAVYWRVVHCGFIALDDPLYVTKNAWVQNGLTADSLRHALTDTADSTWHPVTWVSHLLDCELYGLNPGGHHLTSLGFHIANSLLLFWLWLTMTGAVWPSLCLGLLFAVHPLHVESVAWVAERKDVLSTFFGLLTMLAYCRYVRGPSRTCAAVTAALYALGLMAKPMLVTLPFVLLLLDVWPLGRAALPWTTAPGPHPWRGWFSGIALGPGNLGLLKEKIPLFGLSAAACLTTFWVERRGGAMEVLQDAPAWSHVANALLSYWRYVGKAVYPHDLAIFYPHPGASVSIAWAVVAGCGLVLSCALALLALRRYPYIAVGWFWYVGMLVPVVGLVQVGGQAMADRYMYTPLIGLSVIACWGLPDLLAGWRHRTALLAVVAVSAVTLLSVVCARQVALWKDTATLFGHALKVTPPNAMAHYILGNALMEGGDPGSAIGEFRRALAIAPELAGCHNNLGSAYLRTGQTALAAEQFRAVLALDPQHIRAHLNLAELASREQRDAEVVAHAEAFFRLLPDYLLRHSAWRAAEHAARARGMLVTALIRLGRWDEARTHLEEALRLQPDDASLHNDLGYVLMRQGQYETAASHCRQACKLAPDNAEGFDNLGRAFFGLAQFDAAANAFRRAHELAPDQLDPIVNLGSTYMEQGKATEALNWYRTALAKAEGDPRLQCLLGTALLRSGDPAQAVEYLRRAVGTDPTLADAHGRLALALDGLGLPEEALAEYRQALALRPEWPDILGRYALALIRRDHRTPADNQAAEQAALKACQLVSEQDPECLRALAWVYARTERPAKAAETARQAATRAMERKNTVLADCLKREFGPDGAILPAPLASEQAPP